MSRVRIPPASELGRALEGVFRLIEGDPAGLAFLDTSRAGFLRSFLAYAWCWPAQAFLWAGIWRDVPSVRPEGLAGMVGYFVTAAAFDVASWILPALVLLPFSALFGFRAAYPSLIVATNWFGVVATYLAFVPATIAYLAPIPDSMANVLSLASYIITIWLYFRVARATLNGEALVAVLVTLLTLMTSIFASAAAFRFLGI